MLSDKMNVIMATEDSGIIVTFRFVAPFQGWGQFSS